MAKEYSWISPTEAEVSCFSYDLLNRITEEMTQDLSGHLYSHTKYSYNIFGQKTETRTGDHVTQAFYNSRQDPIKAIDAEGNETHIEYDYYHKNAIDQRVLKIITTDPMGNQTIVEQDVTGKTAIETKKNTFGVLLAQHRNYYDANGNLQLVIHDRIENGEVKNSILTKWTYNNVNQVTSIIEAIGTPEQRIRKYEYNAYGQKSALTKPDGTVLYYCYDAKGRLSSFYSSDNSLSYTYTYNNVDSVLQVYDEVHRTSTTRIYDEQHRLTSETLENGLTIGYEADALGRKTKLILPDQSFVEYVYDAVDLREVHRNGYIHSYASIDTHGNLLESRLPYQAGVINFSYDKLNRERSANHPLRTHSIPLIDGFDKAGNLLKFYVNDGVKDQTHTFAYDDLYQLTSENGHETHQYQYDSLNNRTLKDGSACKSNDLNQLLEQEDLGFKYDLNGNMIEKKTGEATTRFEYDALNRLTTAYTPTDTISYRYDSFDRRLSKNDELYLYDGQNQIGVYKNGNLTALRILGTSLGAEIGGAIALELNNRILIPLHDHNGNIVKLLNPNGTLHKTYDYTVFGLELNLDQNDENPWRFSSKIYDTETGLIYFGRRYYDPQTARWTSPDPTDYEDGPNLYSYVHNNPLTRFDEYGLQTIANDNLAENSNPWYRRSWQSTKEASSYAFDYGSQFVSSAYSNPRVQGGLQAFGGFAEAGVGAGMTLASAGWATPLGWPVMAHGLDHFMTGCRSVYSGILRDTATSQLLQKAGSSQSSANLVDSSLSLACTLGGAASLRASRIALEESRRLPAIRTIDPHNVRFSQNNIKATFKDGRRIDELVEGLKSGNIKKLEVKPIRLVFKEDLFFTLDNRRLAAFQKANVPVPYRMATVEEITKEFYKFSTKNNGISIFIKGE